jgi:hypothetical protein
MKREPTTIQNHDIYSSAYADYKGIPPDLVRENRRVIFLLPDSPRTYQILNEFNNNPKIPLLDFLTHLKKLRAQMISLRG